MLFDGALIAGRCTTDLSRAGDTVIARDLQRDQSALLRLSTHPDAYLECLLEPELLGEFEDVLEIYHTTEPIRFAVSKIHPGDSILPKIDAAFRFDLSLVAPIMEGARPRIPARVNLAGAVNLYWKCHNGGESLPLDTWDHKILEPRR